MSNYKYKIEQYHSIDKADITLNGITVLAGVNGSGKSTLTRWLYYIVKGANDYEQYCFKEYRKLMDNRISRYVRVLNEISEGIDSPTDVLNKAHKTISEMSYSKSSFDQIGEIYSVVIEYVTKVLRKSFATLSENQKKRILKYLQITYLEGESDADILERFQTTQLHNAERQKVEYLQYLKNRPKDFLYKKIFRSYGEDDIPQNISFQEDEVDIIGKDRIENLFELENAIYIDTPMALSITYSSNPFWNELREMLSNHTDNTKSDKIVHKLLSYLRNISGGKIIDQKDILGIEELYFSRNTDNLTIKLENMATGIKTFAYLDRLLENGYLNNNTILIIDEPEAHLHPQWIVEFARMLVYIHKETGLYVMLASHNPDMVSAIRYIAEKEKVLDNTTFYLAEKDNDAETYTYKNCAQDIEPIFASFNKSFELIEKYGEDNS